MGQSTLLQVTLGGTFFSFFKGKIFFKKMIYFNYLCGYKGVWSLEARQELDLQVVVNCYMWMLGTELMSFERAKRALAAEPSFLQGKCFLS